MGIYRTLLEEEITHLDDNNDGAATVEEIQDVIDNAEDNAEEVQAAADAQFDSEGGADPEDIVEESWLAIAESEMMWNSFLQESGLNELFSVHSGRSINEGMNEIKDFFSKAKEKIASFFKKVWQVIQRWTANLTAAITRNKKFAEKYADQIKKGESLYAKGDKPLKGYSFEGINNTDSIINAIKKSSSKAASACQNRANWYSSKSVDFNDPDETVNDSNDINELMKIDIPGVNLNSENLHTDCSKYFYGSEDPKDGYIMPADDVIKCLKDVDNAKKTAKKALDESKKEFNDAMKAIKMLEKNVNNKHYENEKTSNAISKIAVSTESILDKNLKSLQIIRSCLLSAISKRKAQARRYGMAYVRAANKGNEKYKGFRIPLAMVILVGLTLFN